MNPPPVVDLGIPHLTFELSGAPPNNGINEIHQALLTDPGEAHVADVAFVRLAVSHELGGALDKAVVHLVVEEAVNRHHYRLLHFVRDHVPHNRLHLRLQDQIPPANNRVLRDGTAPLSNHSTKIS